MIRYLRDVTWQSVAILALAVALALAVNHFRADGIPLVGDWSHNAQLSGLETIEEPVVSLDEARALFLTGGAVFVDARSPDDYASGHIQGAVNIPADSFQEYFIRAIPLLPPDSIIVAYCDGETCTLSKEVAFDLSGKGYSHVRVLVNGWSAWLDAKLPVEAGS